MVMSVMFPAYGLSGARQAVYPIEPKGSKRSCSVDDGGLLRLLIYHVHSLGLPHLVAGIFRLNQEITNDRVTIASVR